MNILLVNDDGFTDQIEILYDLLKEQGHNVLVCLPDQNRSGSGGAITIGKDINVFKLDDQQYVISGTPVDCVHVGLHLANQKSINIDMVISGPNRGANLADDWLYSGTVCAALEANRMKIRSMAISLIPYDRDYNNVEEIRSKLLQAMQVHFSYGVACINIPLNGKNSKVRFTNSGTRVHQFSIDRVYDDDRVLRIGEIGSFNSITESDHHVIDDGDISFTLLNY